MQWFGCSGGKKEGVDGVHTLGFGSGRISAGLVQIRPLALCPAS